MAKRGNPGYGKSEMIRQNVDKFAPVFWQLMEELSKSKKAEDKRLFITEFNKLQVKMIPQKLAGDDEDDAPIKIQVVTYGGNNSPSQLLSKILPATPPTSS